MTVAELRRALEGQPAERLVVTENEENRFSDIVGTHDEDSLLGMLVVLRTRQHWERSP